MSPSRRPAVPPGERPAFLHPDAIVGVVLLALCGACYWLTTAFDALPAMLAQNVPPTFFPRLVLGLIALLAFLMLFDVRKKPHSTRERVKPMVFVTAGLVAGAPLLIAPFGTFVTLFLIMLVLPVVWGERRRAPLLALAFGLPVAVYVVFTLALGVRFPTGALARLFS